MILTYLPHGKRYYVSGRLWFWLLLLMFFLIGEFFALEVPTWGVLWGLEKDWRDWRLMENNDFVRWMLRLDIWSFWIRLVFGGPELLLSSCVIISSIVSSERSNWNWLDVFFIIGQIDHCRFTRQMSWFAQCEICIWTCTFPSTFFSFLKLCNWMSSFHLPVVQTHSSTQHPQDGFQAGHSWSGSYKLHILWLDMVW